jgi:Tol biopolymer transport system component
MPGPIASLAFLLTCGLPAAQASPGATGDAAVARLAEEVRGKGWIVYSARTAEGDWDLFVCRPDGSGARNITHTPDWNEGAPQFSRSGRRLLYRRLARAENFDGNLYGRQGQPMMADADGSNPTPLGEAGELPWASWGPDGRQVACLAIKGVSFIELETRRVVRTLPRKGYFQQLTWSADGKWLVGVANAYGASWSVVRMNAETGGTNPVSRVDCCTPDWHPDNQSIIFSNRPLPQRANKGYGWTQLWTASADGTSRRLVYGEDSRHVYGGQVSPDGKYVLFTGNVQENGDPGRAGSPMGLMRLADAPIIVGAYPELRGRHPDAKAGPVLVLPVGWEPCWTSTEIFPAPATAAAAAPAGPSAAPVADPVAALAAEVKAKGWIACSARSEGGDWDLVLMRPDGSERHALTRTPDTSEVGVRFSPDGTRILYYRMPRGEPLDNNTYGTHELVLADADGGHPDVVGHGHNWASWAPDGKSLACLGKNGIVIVDIATRKVVRRLPRQGIVEQLVWSPDGKSFAGTANGLGPYWNIARLDIETGRLNGVSETERYNCTPDWTPDARSILYSRGIIPGITGWAQIWQASSDGKERRMLYAEDDRPLYGGCSSPDGKYLLFARCEADLGRVDNARTRLALVRRADTPMIGGPSEALRKAYPAAHHGPMLDLSWGWEPHWTYAEIRSAPRAAPTRP